MPSTARWSPSGRTTEVPDYSVQRPIGNTAAATSSGATVGTFAAYSTNGTTFTSAGNGVVGASADPVRDVRRPIRAVHRRLQLGLVGRARRKGISGYMAWTDNRDVVPGTDPRETTQDGFDVHMCVTVTDGVAGPNTCPNAGGFDQNIYGTGIEILP